jgi:hypothetical protein
VAYITILAAVGQLAVCFIVTLGVLHVVAGLEDCLLYRLDVGLGIVNCRCKYLLRLIPRGIRYAIDGVCGLDDAFLARTAVSADLQRDVLICCKCDEWHEQKHDDRLHYVLRKTSVRVFWFASGRRTEPQIMANFAS